jgi:RNA polymerase sigma-70 factor, ECF subfamily
MMEPGSSESVPNLESSMMLFHKAKAGDREALDRLYTRYLPRLSRWASGRLSPTSRHLEDTSDLVQEVLIRFLDKVDEFDPQHPGALMAYLRTALLNRIRDVSRYVARRPDRVDVDKADEAQVATPLSPYEECVAKETTERYEAALQRLSEDEQAAIILKVELDYSNEEMAQELNKPSADAARMFASRALLKLAREMAKAEPAA